MSFSKKLMIGAALLGTVALTAWMAPKSSRGMALNKLFMDYGLEKGFVAVNAETFKISEAVGKELTSDGYFVKLQKEVQNFVLKGDMGSYERVNAALHHLTGLAAVHIQERAESLKASKDDVATAETPAAAPVVGGAANDGAAPDAPAAAA